MFVFGNPEKYLQPPGDPDDSESNPGRLNMIRCITATVTRELANRINETAAAGDRVSGGQLQDRVRYREGAVKMGNSHNNPQPTNRDVVPYVSPFSRKPSSGCFTPGPYKSIPARLPGR